MYPAQRSTQKCLRLVSTATRHCCSKTEILFQNRGISISNFLFELQDVQIPRFDCNGKIATKFQNSYSIFFGIVIKTIMLLYCEKRCRN